MILKILYSNWFAAFWLIVAAISLGLLYYKGMTFEALCGAGALFVALVLILFGSRS